MGQNASIRLKGIVEFASMGSPAPSSVIYQHLLAVIVTEMSSRSALSIVDVGCGGGALIRHLSSALPSALSGCEVEVSGFDLSDFAPHANSNLRAGTKTVKSGEPWPYGDHSVDVIISTQVLEHVFDQAFFFQEVARCLKPDGVSIHVFPLKSVIYEDHVGIPLAHRITRPGWIRFMARIGFFSPRHAKAIPELQTEFGQCAVDYIKKYTKYVNRRQLRLCAKAAGLSLSFAYTPRLYTAKLRSVWKREPAFSYSKTPFFDAASFWVARLISSVTVVLRPEARSTFPD